MALIWLYETGFKITKRAMRSLYLSVVFLVVFAGFISASDAQNNSREIIVVGYTPQQPPFEMAASGAGLIKDLLDLMNKEQDRYRFTKKRLYASRASKAFTEGAYDLTAFQNKSWGLNVEGVTESLVLLKDRGAYFTLVNSRLDDGNLLLGATRGFHYAFADFSIEKLENMPNVLLAANELDVLRLVLRRRVQQGIASEAVLRWFQHSNKELGDKLILLPKTDSDFTRSFVILPKSRIKKGQLDQLLVRLAKKRLLDPLFAKYGLEAPVFEKTVTNTPSP